MNRPFNTRQPNLTSSDRIKNLKAKAIYKSAKSSFRHGNKKNANGKIHFTQTGTLRSTRSHELGLLLNRGYALCEDGICPPCVPDCACDGGTQQLQLSSVNGDILPPTVFVVGATITQPSTGATATITGTPFAPSAFYNDIFIRYDDCYGGADFAMEYTPGGPNSRLCINSVCIGGPGTDITMGWPVGGGVQGRGAAAGSGVLPRGLFQCAKSPNWSSVTPQTENNLYTHFVSAYLPKMEGGIPFPMGAWPQDISATSGANFLQQLNWGYDPTGGPGINFSGTEHENDMDPMGYYKVNPECRRMGGGSMTFRRPATGTMIRGEQDINGHYTVCQGGNKANLTWGNSTKQNYLISYDPRNTKVRFNICEKTKDISQCYIGTPPDISNCAVVFDYSGCRICT